MYYYVCKRCNYVSKQKIDMKRHLDKKKKCKLHPENICILSNDEMYNLSLDKNMFEYVANVRYLYKLDVIAYLMLFLKFYKFLVVLFGI